MGGHRVHELLAQGRQVGDNECEWTLFLRRQCREPLPSGCGCTSRAEPAFQFVHPWSVLPGEFLVVAPEMTVRSGAAVNRSQ